MIKKVCIDDVCRKKYIYLDWNVFKYIKEPRKEYEELDMQVRDIVLKSRNKYVYPFCEAHLRDRANKYKPEYRDKIEEDFKFVADISEEFCLAYTPEFGLLQPIKQSISEMFENILNAERQPLDLSNIYPQMISFEVDKKDIERDGLLNRFFLEEKVVWTREKMCEVVEALFWESFENNDIYKDYRERQWKYGERREEKNINDVYYNKGKECFEKLVSCYESSDFEYIILNWKEAIIDALKLHCNEKEIDGNSLISTAYCMLDFHPMLHDRLSKKNTFSHIQRDSRHAWYASQACMFVTEDTHTYKKMKILYKAFDIKTKVLTMSEFKSRMEIY